MILYEYEYIYVDRQIRTCCRRWGGMSASPQTIMGVWPGFLTLYVYLDAACFCPRCCGSVFIVLVFAVVHT